KRGMNITVEQWVLLKIVHEKSPISQTELAEFSLRDPASITRTLDILGKKGLADRENIEGNRRQYNIVLTKAGEKFVDAHMDFIEKQRAQSLMGMNEKDQKTFNRLLKQMQENMT
ncbi:MAG: MarR family transcriptional regulator, partial [Cryomorphaceae bacterium]